MRRKKVAFSFLIIILLMFLVIYFYIFFLNKNEENYNPKKDQNLSMVTVNENQYYIVYINANNGTGSSFVPLTLNPGLENDSNLNVSISFDDDGNIINKYPPAKLVVFHKPYKGKLLACVLRRINGPAAAFYFTCYP